MPRWLYYSLILTIVAPLLSLVPGPKPAMVIFIFAVLGLIPLATLIGRATENLEFYVGPTTGGLLNATFGNAPELIIGIVALQAGLVSVVKASITGSIISNALLVLGGSLALGGWRWGEQYFSNRDAGEYSAMMVLAVAGLLIPYTASVTPANKISTEPISIGISIVLLCTYVMYLALTVFHVRSERRNPFRRGKITVPLKPPLEGDEQESEVVEGVTGGVDPRELGETKPSAPWISLLILFGATIGTAWNSELLVGTLETVAHQLGWTPVFIGLVIVPIVGNAAEHSSALIVAYKDRVDLSVAIAAGSSIQVATFVAPVLVLSSLFFTHHLDLVFQPLELVLVGLATILFTFVSLDGKSTWLEGMQLLAVYVMACVVFFLLPG